ncbi:phage portal protein [Lentisphaerota bacterium WC36G]|nr:phage portal protein [Lentisphaerae bacterium WC36]
MKILGWKISKAPKKTIKASNTSHYDVARTNRHNVKHWQYANNFDADSILNSTTRQIIRTRARYEIDNNEYADGIRETLANDTIGTGPRLQINDLNSKQALEIEQSFRKWTRKIDWAEKLRLVRKAMLTDGENFTRLTTDSKLDHIVKLDLQLIETDRVTSDYNSINKANEREGLIFDPDNNKVIAYKVLKEHPGSTASWLPASKLTGEFETIDAKYMIHLFRAKRTEQHRGVCEITSALPTFSHLRRFMNSTLDAAEFAASYSGIIYKDGSEVEEEESLALDTGDMFQMERNNLLVVPPNHKISQLDSKHPQTTFPAFKREIITAMARPISMPYNIAAGDSSSYNYASGRLDHQTYHKSIRVCRNYLEINALDRIFYAWLEEYKVATKQLTLQIADISWFWDGFEHVDPLKEANAQSRRLESKTTTYAAEFAKEGKDYEVEMLQIAKEQALMKKLGITKEDINKKLTSEKKRQG